MAYLGSWAIDNSLTFVCVTQVFATGVATDADSVPTYRVYEDETGTAILTGSMALLDSSNTAGFYSEQITLSAANGFEKGKCYSVYIAATVSSVAGAKCDTFQIEAEVDANRLNWAQVDAPTTTNALTGTTISTSQVVASVSGAVGSVTGAVGSVTGAVGSVTGNVGGNVTGSVGSVAGAVGSVTGNVGGNVVGSVGSVTGNVSGSVASVTAAVTLTSGERDSVADALLDRNMATGTDSGSPSVRTVRQALRMLRNKWSVASGTLTVTKEDDSTSSWTATVATTAGVDPVTGVDPA